MPITRGAKKKQRQDKKRHDQNLVVKNAAKKAVKEYRNSPTEKALTAVFSVLDTTIKKNIYHKNKVARLKSRLTKLVSKSSTPKNEEPAKTAKKTTKKAVKKSNKSTK